MPQVVPAAHRALQVFETFARERKPLSNSEMARLLDLAESSCSDLLHTLREGGYLLRTPRSRLFYPSTRIGDLARRIAASDPLQIFAKEVLEELSQRSGETSMCGYLDGTQVKIYACQESTRALRYVLEPGTAVDVHATAVGKAILGAMPSLEREALIEKLTMRAVTSNTIVDREVLQREIEQGIGRQWFMAKDEGSEGVCAVGIAGRFSDRVIGLTIVGPTHRLTKGLEEYVQILREVGKEFF